jgi:RNA polymerase sigma-B factor
MGDRTLRNALVEYGWIARRCARRIVHRGEPFKDLVQVGQLGVLKAVERFDPAYGVPLWGYAMPTVLRELRRHFRDHTGVISAPGRMKELAVELSTQQPLLEQRLGRSPSTAELSEHQRITEDELLKVMAARRTYGTMPFVTVDDDDSGAVLAGDGDGHETDLDRVMLWQALASLADEDRAIIVLRYFSG